MIITACNILAEGAQYFALQNYGYARNCTLTTLYPAVVTILNMDVGGLKEENYINYDVSVDKLDNNSRGLRRILIMVILNTHKGQKILKVLNS